MKKNLKNTTTDALLYHLGYDTPRPIMRAVLATALDMLTPEAKADLIQYLTEDRTETYCGCNEYGVCGNCSIGEVV